MIKKIIFLETQAKSSLTLNKKLVRFLKPANYKTAGKNQLDLLEKTLELGVKTFQTCFQNSILRVQRDIVAKNAHFQHSLANLVKSFQTSRTFLSDLKKTKFSKIVRISMGV